MRAGVAGGGGVGARRARRRGRRRGAPRDGRGHEDGDGRLGAVRRHGAAGVRAAEQPGRPGHAARASRGGGRGPGQEDGPEGGVRRRQDGRRAGRRAPGFQGPGPAEGASRPDCASSSAPSPEPAPSVLPAMQSVMLGFDLDAAEVERVLAGVRPAHPVRCRRTTRELLRAEDDLLRVFVDVRAVFGRQSADEDEGSPSLSSEQYLFRYLRTLDSQGADLPAAFLDQLRTALQHYNVSDPRADARPARGAAGAVQGLPAQRPPGAGRPGGARAAPGGRTTPWRRGARRFFGSSSA